MKIASGPAGRHKIVVDLIGLEDGAAAIGLGFLAHAGPDVGVDGVGARERSAGELVMRTDAPVTAASPSACATISGLGS